MAATLSTSFLGRALKVGNTQAARPALPARGPVVTKALFTSKKAAPKKVIVLFFSLFPLLDISLAFDLRGAAFSRLNLHCGAF